MDQHGSPGEPERMLARLATSSFRARFHLSTRERAYARAKGRATIARHARELLTARVGPARPDRDGRQTPYRGHPVFTAQHATATCCRGCVERWYGIPRGRPLSPAELDRLCAVVMAWIDRQMREDAAAPLPKRAERGRGRRRPPDGGTQQELPLRPDARR